MNPEPIFADTNLFLRYLTNDIPAQALAVEQLLHQAANGEVLLITNSMIIAEIVWTLESFYGLTRDDVKEKVLAIINTPGLEVRDGDLVLQAISWYADKNVDFIDAYNGAWMFEQGLQMILTFDRKHFSRLENVKVRVLGEEA